MLLIMWLSMIIKGFNEVNVCVYFMRWIYKIIRVVDEMFMCIIRVYVLL